MGFGFEKEGINLYSEIMLSVGDFGYIKTLQANQVSQGYIDALNNKELTHFMEIGERQYNSEDISCYIQSNISDPAAYLFGVFSKENELVGTSRLHDISVYDGIAWMGIFLFSKDIMGRGVGSQVVKSVSSYALDKLALGRIQAGIITENAASRACFRKAGFSLLAEEKNYRGRSREIWAREASGN